MSPSQNDIKKDESISIEPARIENVPGMADCHAIAFPGRFMSEMGHGWLCALYLYFINQSGGICYVASDCAGKVVGFAAGGEPDIRGRFLRAAMWRYPHIIFWKFLTKPLVRSVLLEELFKKLHLKHKPLSPEEIATSETSVKCGNLLSICVLPDYRGAGVAGRLIEDFYKACVAKGYRRLTLSVLTENCRAVAFYKKHHWRETGISGASTKFALDIDIDKSDSDK
ncbi:MAG: GNAT family N-acetyltransferase [Sedimentisphaerales bacterium]|nr:GNAT family N-acetyltransferase [Sedimentisphaerales bacterium]